jgi:hypothetical protein
LWCVDGFLLLVSSFLRVKKKAQDENASCAFEREYVSYDPVSSS